MTKQEIFDKVSKHLLTQGRKAVRADDSDLCCYLMKLDNGQVLKCAIGCLIPDELYDPKIEFKMSDDELVRSILLSAGVVSEAEPNLAFLNGLQSVHDHNEPYEWPWALAKFAEKHGLKFVEVDQSALGVK
jgi:hypothetical protein